YPDPFTDLQLKKITATIKDIDQNQVFIGNGSDEAIDLLFRAFCNPGKDKAYIFTPTYGMYEVSAQINNIDIERIELNSEFRLPPLIQYIDRIQSNGLIFICSPNNPTGNIQSLVAIKEITDHFKGIVVVDEAYIDFSNSLSAISLIENSPNLVVLQTLSKAYGLAGLRIGMAYSNLKIIEVLNKIKAPYNINSISQTKAINALKKNICASQINEIKAQRKRMLIELNGLSKVKKVYPSETNFILATFEKADEVHQALKQKGIIIRNRSKQIENALRITIGTPDENTILLQALKTI
ncbi:UNVERIFIED_CONTAM: hypothetical protein GTU68_015385, partial [Idotea baltica]|nr:hypothetical protein [Idotea baltica]